MTAHKVRLRIQSPSASSAATTPTANTPTGTNASRPTSSSRCSKCSHCRDRAGGLSRHADVLGRASTPHHNIAAYNTPPPAPAPPGIVPGTFASVPPIPMQPVYQPHEPRLHPFAPAPVLHHLGRGPEPLFGWESVMPLNHTYGQPRYLRRTKPDYRRFCFSVGKADVPFAAMPGGPLWGMGMTMAPQMVGSHRW